jgi:hypothetical protein
MNPRRRIASGIVVLISALQLVGCTDAVVTLPPNIKYPGMETYPTPRAFDSPGTIFRIDNAGVRHYVDTLDIHAEGPLDEALVQVKRDGTISLSLLAQLLGKLKAIDSGSASVKSDTNTVETVNLTGGHRFRAKDSDVDTAVTNLKLRFKPKNRYYVVRETVAVDAVEYTLTRAATTDAKAAAKINQMVDASAGITWKDQANNSLVQKFDKPRNFFYIRDEIFPPATGATAGPDSRPSHARVPPETGGQTWSAEGRGDNSRK